MSMERMGHLSAEGWCRLTLQGLAASFAVVGGIFFCFPDGTIRVMNTVGGWLGNFTPATPSALRFWLSLGTGYMALVTALAYLAQRDLRGRRELLLLLALGKATSSLTCWGYYVYSSPAFIYLANFLVDGSIAVIALIIWLVIPSLRAPISSPVATPTLAETPPAAQAMFQALVDTMLPPGGPFEEGGGDAVRAEDIEAFVGALGGSASRGFRLALTLLDFCPLVLPPRRGRRFSRLPAAERELVLEAWEASRLPPLRQFVHTLKLLVMTHFYSRPQIEARLGYPHPLVRVPRAETV